VASGARGDSPWLNLAAMIQRFESDEVPGARVLVRFPGGEHEVTADDEGYFECWIEPRPTFSPSALWHEIVVELLHPREGDQPHRQIASLLVPPPESAFGVISDLDDTVVKTGATSLLRMARTTFLSNARTRVPFPGVAAFYRALQKGAGESPFNPVFYVSSSPWNLHDLLTEFLTLQKIPIGPLLLRDWGLNSNESLSTRHAGHKLAGIRRILDLFPALPFILIGDSGQEDPEIYAAIAREAPDRVAAIYIRHTTGVDLGRNAQVDRLAAEITAFGVPMLAADDSAQIAVHAAGLGLLDGDAVAAVRAELG
jgi:phosphatidate phosphatase APP1